MQSKGKDNPALKITNYYSFALEVLNEINGARVAPKDYLKKLEKIKALTEAQEDKNTINVQGVPIKYTDLQGSLKSAIEFLQKQDPVSPLKYNKNISMGADELLSFLILHDGMNMEETSNPFFGIERRLKSNGEAYGEVYELIDYGMFSPEYVVINFVLSDGDNDRCDRFILFNKVITSAGIAVGLLPSDRICTVINFAECFFNPGEIVPEITRKKYQEKTYNIEKISKTVNPYMGMSNESFGSSNVRRRVSGELFKQKRTQYLGKNKYSFETYQPKGITPSDFEKINRSPDSDEDSDDANGKKEAQKVNMSQQQIQMPSQQMQRPAIIEIPEEFQKMDDSDDDTLPAGAAKVMKKQQIVQDSNGVRVRLVKKVIQFDDGTITSYLYKKPIQ